MTEQLRHEAPECVSPMGAKLGEGPLWDPRDNGLYWLDIKGEIIFRYDPQSGSTDTIRAPGMISALGLARSGGYIGVGRDGFLRLDIEGGKARTIPLTNPEEGKSGNRFNDGKVDPKGGFWAGTMDDAEKSVTGSWWRLAPCGAMKRLDQGFHVTNGPAFDSDRGRVYFTDSAKRTVFTADSDGVDLRDKRIFLQFDAGSGYPDGMEVDAKGYVWIAFWDGGVVRRFSPDSRLCGEIDIPITRPTSIAFVNDTLFVTSASIGLSDETRLRHPLSGGLFRIQISYELGAAARYFEDSQSPQET